jgi:hypothetical protein
MHPVQRGSFFPPMEHIGGRTATRAPTCSVSLAPHADWQSIILRKKNPRSLGGVVAARGITKVGQEIVSRNSTRSAATF